MVWGKPYVCQCLEVHPYGDFSDYCFRYVKYRKRFLEKESITAGFCIAFAGLDHITKLTPLFPGLLCGWLRDWPRMCVGEV